MHDTVQSLGAHQGTFAITQKATAGGTNTQNSSLNKSERKSWAKCPGRHQGRQKFFYLGIREGCIYILNYVNQILQWTVILSFPEGKLWMRENSNMWMFRHGKWWFPPSPSLPSLLPHTLSLPPNHPSFFLSFFSFPPSYPQRVSNKMNPNRLTPRYNKISKLKKLKKILKAARE